MSTSTTIPASTTVSASTTTNQDHASRLHTAYVSLTFKCDPNDPQDTRREGLFKRLVLHHLMDNMMYTLSDWRDLRRQAECTFDFLNTHANALWPGAMASRSHLANAPMTGWGRGGRSFVGSIDGFWNGKSGGSRKRVNAMINDETIDLETLGGLKWQSVIGKAFCGYVGVLLEPALNNANVEDDGKLVAGILGVVLGPEILPVEVDDEQVNVVEDWDENEGEDWMPVKVQGESEGEAAVKAKVGDESD
jgi:hypothetical protein